MSNFAILHKDLLQIGLSYLLIQVSDKDASAVNFERIQRTGSGDLACIDRFNVGCPLYPPFLRVLGCTKSL